MQQVMTSVLSPTPLTAPTHRAQRPLYFDAREFRRVNQLLDIGGGPGFVASLLKEEHPAIRITVFDLPDICDYALDIFRESGQGRDLGAHPGDFFRDPFPSGFRVMQFSHVLEMLPQERTLHLLRKAFAALPRGGQLFIYGRVGEKDFGDGASGPHTARQYRHWLHAVGFSKVTSRADTAHHAFIAATK